jgi:hypothetical protein
MNMAISLAKGVFTLGHYFAGKSFSAVRETFRILNPYKDVMNKTIIHRLVTNY